MLCSHKKCLSSSKVNVFYQALLPGSILPPAGAQEINLHGFFQRFSHLHVWQAEEGEHQPCSAQGLSIYHQALDHHSQLAFTLLAPMLGDLSASVCLLKLKVSLAASSYAVPFPAPRLKSHHPMFIESNIRIIQICFTGSGGARLQVISTVISPYPQISHLWIQPTVDEKFSGKTNPRMFQKARLKYATCQTLCQTHMNELCVRKTLL